MGAMGSSHLNMRSLPRLVGSGKLTLVVKPSRDTGLGIITLVAALIVLKLAKLPGLKMMRTQPWPKGLG